MIVVSGRSPTHREERADDRGEDRDAAERERVQPQVGASVGGEPDSEQHDGDGGPRRTSRRDRRPCRRVADVVADVVRDDGRVARVVFGDAGLDLADEVCADVGRLRVDAAAEPGEDRDRGSRRKPAR